MRRQENIKELYDRVYSQRDNVFNTDKNNPLFNEVHKHAKLGNVFDIGAGEGLNSLWFARRGYNVDAMDISSVAIQKIKDAARCNNLNITAFVGDISKYVIDKKYDIVLMLHVMHHIISEEVPNIVETIKKNTSEGGTHIVSLFTKNSDFYKQDIKTNFYYDANMEVLDLYKGWDVLSADIFIEESAAGGAKNEILTIVVQKVI